MNAMNFPYRRDVFPLRRCEAATQRLYSIASIALYFLRSLREKIISRNERHERHAMNAMNFPYRRDVFPLRRCEKHLPLCKYIANSPSIFVLPT
jgi:hypothetical protein